MMKIDEKIKKTGNLTLFGPINDYPCFAPGALAESPIEQDTVVTPSVWSSVPIVPIVCCLLHI